MAAGADETVTGSEYFNEFLKAVSKIIEQFWQAVALLRAMPEKSQEHIRVIRRELMGTAKIQGQIWGTRARDWAEVQEGFTIPLYEAVLNRTLKGELNDEATK